jgi:hypothetical protein
VVLDKLRSKKGKRKKQAGQNIPPLVSQSTIHRAEYLAVQHLDQETIHPYQEIRRRDRRQGPETNLTDRKHQKAAFIRCPDNNHGMVRLFIRQRLRNQVE